MDLKKAREIIEGEIYQADGSYAPYIDISNAWDNECKTFVCAIETLLKELDKKDKIINELEEKIEYLEKENKVVRIFKKSMPKDTEIVVMTKVNFEKNFKKEE